MSYGRWSAWILWLIPDAARAVQAVDEGLDPGDVLRAGEVHVGVEVQGAGLRYPVIEVDRQG